MAIIEPDFVQPRYDLVIGGTGFGSIFFLHGFLRRFPRSRVLMLEWGKFRDHEWQVEQQRNSDIDSSSTFVSNPNEKPWYYTLGIGGGTNCWWANTPRLAPNDFQLKTKYGVGEDWPLRYEDIEPYYVAAEQLMLVAGPNDLGTKYPRSAPYPQPAHNMSTVDKMMKAAMPDHHFAVPTARLSLPVGSRAACCDSVQCSFCPVDAKFTALNTFDSLFDSPNVDVLCNARVLAVDIEAGLARGMRYSINGREGIAKGDLVAVGCNAIQSPFILMRSGLAHPALGKYLHEKYVLEYEILLDGVDHFDGGIPSTGINTLLLDGDHRRNGGGGLVYFVNHYYRDGLRIEWDRWRQTLPIEIFIEDLPLETNMVKDDGGDLPVVSHPGISNYCKRGINRAISKLPELLAPLPVERIIRREDLPTGFHIQGTCRMGKDPATSIVDADLLHHHVRNLLVLGTSVWPSCGTANPSLTAAALSLRAAANIGA